MQDYLRATKDRPIDMNVSNMVRLVLTKHLLLDVALQLDNSLSAQYNEAQVLPYMRNVQTT
jgi:hypothetical protein